MISVYFVMFQGCVDHRGEFVGNACGHHGPYVPDVLFWSIILFFSTVAMSSFLKEFKTSRYFPTKARSLCVFDIMSYCLYLLPYWPKVIYGDVIFCTLFALNAQSKFCVSSLGESGDQRLRCFFHHPDHGSCRLRSWNPLSQTTGS